MAGVGVASRQKRILQPCDRNTEAATRANSLEKNRVS